MLHPPVADRIRAAAAADSAAPRNEFLFKPPLGLDTLLMGLLQDPRDAPLAFLLADVALVTLPLAAAAFWLRLTSHALGALYLVLNYAFFLERFMLTLHFTEHRRLFRKGAGLLNLAAPLLLAPLFGVPSGMYRLHHCVMHHVDGNAAGRDLSSTEPFQRDSPLHFLWYWLRHAVLGWVEVPLRAAAAGRLRPLAACLGAEACYLLAARLLWLRCPVATVWVVLVPYLVSSLALMLGNWSQHIFIDPGDPRSAYGLAYTCVACPDNQRTYNDGYHVAHHLNSQAHWTELPARFAAGLEQHAAAGALVFQGIGFFDVGVAVFTRRYSFLLAHLPRYTADLAAASDEELVALLRARLRPIEQQRQRAGAGTRPKGAVTRRLV